MESVGTLIDVAFAAGANTLNTCPQKYVPIEAFMPGLDQKLVDHSTEEWLDQIENKLDYNAWYCGHWHIDKRIDKMHFLMHSVEAL